MLKTIKSREATESLKMKKNEIYDALGEQLLLGLRVGGRIKIFYRSMESYKKYFGVE